MAIGFDPGTMHLVCARRDGQELKYRKEVNAFLEIDLAQRFTFNRLKAAGVRLIERDQVAYMVGEAAMQFAQSMPQLQVRRPMKDGCLNASEKDAFRNLMIMIHSLIGEASQDQEILYYAVPAEPVNVDMDTGFHQKVLEEIFKKYKVNDKTLRPFPINEALALVFAELESKNYTGFAASFGAGQVNVCYAMYSLPVVQFSIVNSGDWIDEHAAKACSENTAYVNRVKHGIDLTKSPNNMVERAIQSQYRIMVERTVAEMKKALLSSNKSIKTENPVDMIVAGGTSMPNGFVELFRETVMQAGLPVSIAEVRRPADPLFAVARGCLIAAESAQ